MFFIEVKGIFESIRRPKNLIWTLSFILQIAAFLSVRSSATLAHEVSEQEAEELKPIEVKTRRPYGSASSQVIGELELSLLPNRRTGDLLELVPGLTAIQHAGGGKANQYFLRGFDNDHGTDIAFTLEDIPINNVSHGHGQGYTDLNFIIPETLEGIEVRKGPYFAQDGDFATAGAVNFRLKEKVDENLMSVQAGRFDSYRGLILGGSHTEKGGGYVAGEFFTDDGPFENPNDYFRLNLLARGHFKTDKWKGVFTGSAYSGSWNASNQIPVALVESGALSRFGAIDPSDGGESRRFQGSAQFTYTPDEKQHLHLLLYGYHYDLDLFSNFTFFLDDPVNGDQIEQVDKRQAAGFRGVYKRSDSQGNVRFNTSAGLGLRFDRIHNQLNHTVERRLLSQTTDNRIYQYNPYFYAQEEFVLTDWLKIVAGLRFDVLHFDVTDFLGQGVQGNDTAFIFSPKASVVFTPKENVDVYLNFGQGFHSNDARGVLNPVDPADPFARANGAEVGVHAYLFNRLDVAADFWYLGLGSELVFVGDAGTTEPKNGSDRFGTELAVRYRILNWLFADFDFTYSHARFRDLPSGQNFVPLAPRWTLSGGISAKHSSGFYGALRGRAISDLPANEDDSLTAEGYMVWDLMAGYKRKTDWFGNGRGGFALQLDILNLFNADYRESQFDTTSRPVSGGAEITDIHFTPGYPITVLGTVSLFF